MELTELIIFTCSSITGGQLQLLLWSACDAGVDLSRLFVYQR